MGTFGGAYACLWKPAIIRVRDRQTGGGGVGDEAGCLLYYDQTKLRVNMDPLSISASIIALMQLSSTVIAFLSDAKGSRREQQKIRLEICNTLPMSSILQDQAQQAEDGDKWSSTLLSLSAADGPIQQFQKALERLEHKLAPVRGAKKVGKALI